MIRKALFAGLSLLVCLFAAGPTFGADSNSSRNVTIYFFWGDGCPHCAEEKPFLEGLKAKYPGLTVKSFEVWYNPENKELYRKVAAAYGQESGSVPATFVDFRNWVGFDASRAKEIEEAVEQCFQFGCLDPADVMARSSDPARAVQTSPAPAPAPSTTTTLPIVGSVDTATMSLPLLTLILAGLDGFNPCAFFVLLMLLSLMVHARSRTRMLVVGGVFVFFSGFIYFLFMAAWLNLFMVTGHVSAITIVAGLLAVVMGAINIKEYFFLKKGVSLTLTDGAKNSLFAKMRGLITTGSMPGLVLGTATLAVMANLYELLCTAGFPMVFTRALTLQKLTTAQYYLYLVLYNVIYVIPLLVIVIVFAWTLGSRKLKEEEGRTLKLVSGLMMLGLGVIFIARPQLLNNIAVSVGLITGAIVLTALISRFSGRSR